jgi:hypothetical protein
MRHTSVHAMIGQLLVAVLALENPLTFFSRDIHGFDGPIKVSFGNYTYPIMQDFLRATESQGIPTTDDLQNLVTGQYVASIVQWKIIG